MNTWENQKDMWLKVWILAVFCVSTGMSELNDLLDIESLNPSEPHWLRCYPGVHARALAYLKNWPRVWFWKDHYMTYFLLKVKVNTSFL